MSFSIIMWIAIYFMGEIIDMFQIRREYLLMSIVWFIFINGYCFIGLGRVGPKELVPIIAIIECVFSFLVTFSIPIQLAIVKTTVPDPNPKITFETFLEDTQFNGPQLIENYARSHLCVENYLFLRDVKIYRSIDNPDDRIDMFLKLKEDYFSGGENQINVHVSYINEINNLPMKEIAKDSFDRTYDEVSKIFFSSHFNAFKNQKDVRLFIQNLESRYAH